MSDISDTRRHAAKVPVVSTTILVALAGLSLVAGVAASLYVLSRAGQGGRSAGADVLLSVGCLLGGMATGCLLWGASHLLRRRSRAALLHASAQRTLRQRAASAPGSGGFLAGPAVPPAPPALAPRAPQPPVVAVDSGGARSAEQQLLQDILAQLKALNENLLLMPEQRQAKLRQQRGQLAGRFIGQIERAIEAGQFPRAERDLAEFAEEMPEETDAHQRLGERIIEIRDAAKLAEIKGRTREVYDLMAVSAFDRSEALAVELRDKYPEEPKLTELVDRVRREGRMFLDERRDRLYREVVRLAEARQWRAALEAARKFVESFSEGVNADAIRAMMPTIEDNARIEEVREIRDHIRDLIERRRYAEALQAAEEIIRRFPDTRAAGELKQQLGRLRELSKNSAGHHPSER